MNLLLPATNPISFSLMTGHMLGEKLNTTQQPTSFRSPRLLGAVFPHGAIRLMGVGVPQVNALLALVRAQHLALAEVVVADLAQ
jgi:hypothetical protein